MNADNQNSSPGGDDSRWVELVTEQVRSLSYGMVEIVVHDSRVIQVEKTERLRLRKKNQKPICPIKQT